MSVTSGVHWHHIFMVPARPLVRVLYKRMMNQRREPSATAGAVEVLEKPNVVGLLHCVWARFVFAGHMKPFGAGTEAPARYGW